MAENFPKRDHPFSLDLFLRGIEADISKFPLNLFDLKEEAILSSFFDLSLIQDSFRFRVQRRSLRIANFLINEDGEIKQEELLLLIEAIKKSPYVLMPNGTNDGILCSHLLRILLKLKDEPSFIKAVKRFRKPLCHRLAEKMVKDTIGLSVETVLTDAHIRRAVLSSCLSLLRQNVGSCFATAPAILIHEENLDLYLQDLYELLTTGKLKRIFGGVEHMVPMSPSWGMGDLKRRISLSDDLSSFWLSPGMLLAFESAGLIDPKEPLEERFMRQKQLVISQMEKDKALTVQKLIHNVLLEHFGISDEDLLNFERTEQENALKERYFRGGIREGGRSKKRNECQEFLQKEAEAFAAFKGATENALLKMWEFTLASFSESKLEFSRWNLYTSLGFNPEEKGGIGEILFSYINEKLEENNRKVQGFHQDYEIAFEQLRATEALLRQASNETDARRLKAEHQSRAYHLHSCLDMRERAYAAASHYATFFSFLIKQFDAKFPEYFQEIYDAEMQDYQADQYDDSPAGFRLVYKHGRSDASLWTLIYNEEQYISSLGDFFLAVEPQIAGSCEWEQGSQEVQELTSKIVAYIRTREFLETAFQRMAKAHKSSYIKNIGVEKIEKKPWSYTSGGTMTNLLKFYYKREADLFEESRWVENETDLLIFILDSLKSLPPSTMDLYLNDPNKGMLISSPSHAFILHPGWEFIREGWQDAGFTYTWVRDRLVAPAQKFYRSISLSPAEQAFLFECYADELSPFSAHQLRKAKIAFGKTASVMEFRKLLTEGVIHQFRPKDKVQNILDRIDAFLYQMLPLTAASDWKNAVRKILSHVFDDHFEEALDKIPSPAEWITAKTLRELAVTAFFLSKRSCQISFDLPSYVCTRAQLIGLSSPFPLIFADTNWPNYYFSFLVNPGTSRLELWRTDRCGSQGIAMSEWKQFLDGSNKNPWSILVRPHEYTF